MNMNKLIAAIIALIVVAGAFYFWKGGSTTPTTSNAGASVVPSVSASDDIDSLQADLSAQSSAPDLSGLNEIR